jgi:hypothetical protein
MAKKLDLNDQREVTPTERGVLDLIDAGLAYRTRQRKRRDYLGASLIGKECDRAVQLDYIADTRDDAPKVPEDKEHAAPRTQRIFDTGNMIEDLAIRWTREAGFLLKVRNRDGKQIGFSTAGDRFKGNVDGIIGGMADGFVAPPGMTFPLLWEHKGLNEKNFAAVRKHGIRKAKPEYYAQVQVYMAYLDLDQCLFMTTCKNDGSVEVEIIDLDPSFAQGVSDKAVRIIEATDNGELVPRGPPAPDHFLCRFCKWQKPCWEDLP